MAAVCFPEPEVVITQPWLDISLLIIKFDTFRYSDLLRITALSNWNRKLIRDVNGHRLENFNDVIITTPPIVRFT